MIPLDASDFVFATDGESVVYFRKIVEDMMRCFGITREEAVGRINQEWSHVPAVVGDDIMYHEFPKYWAHHFMFGKPSFWWITGAKREQMQLPALRRLAYPRPPQT